MGRSALIAAVAVVVLVLWMLSGQLGSSDTDDQSDASGTQNNTNKTVSRMKVQTRVLNAESMNREIVMQGQLEPINVLSVRSETSGNIKTIALQKGQRVGRGQTLASLTIDNRTADLAVAQANLVQANNEYQAASKLSKQGLQSKFSLETASAKREAARAQLQAAQLEIGNTDITAPIDALIEDVLVKEGDFVERGAHIATLIDNSQLLVTGRVPQQYIADIENGQKAVAKLVTGQTLSGRVNYVSSMADDTTRSFQVEILIDSPPARTLTGISAQISIPVETLMAHRVSPALLALDDEGTLGIKSIDENNTVVFHEIEVVRTESNGAWVRGLPDTVTLITMGQGFVNPGEEVEPIAAPDSDNTSDTDANDNQAESSVPQKSVI